MSENPVPVEVYQLRVQIDIQKGTQVNYPGQPPYFSMASNERLSVSESLDLGMLDFLGVMKILGELHDAVERIRRTPPGQETLL